MYIFVGFPAFCWTAFHTGYEQGGGHFFGSNTDKCASILLTFCCGFYYYFSPKATKKFNFKSFLLVEEMRRWRGQGLGVHNKSEPECRFVFGVAACNMFILIVGDSRKIRCLKGRHNATATKATV